MDIINSTQLFQTRWGGTHGLRFIGPDHMRDIVKEAQDHGATVSVCTGAKGRKYINVHNGGSSYGTYFYMG